MEYSQCEILGSYIPNEYIVNHYVRPTCEGFLHKFIKFHTHKFADSLHLAWHVCIYCIWRNPFVYMIMSGHCACVRFLLISADFSIQSHLCILPAFQPILARIPCLPLAKSLWHVVGQQAGCWPIYGHGYYKLWPSYWFAVAILLLRVLTVDSWVTRSLSGAGRGNASASASASGSGWQKSGYQDPRAWTRFCASWDIGTYVHTYICVSIALCVFVCAIAVNVQSVDSFPF